MLKKDLEGKLTQLRSGASLDFSCSYGDNRSNLLKTYDIISQFLKITQAYSPDELLKILYTISLHTSYCIDCQRGFKNSVMKGTDEKHKAWCPNCFRGYQKRLKEAGVL